jgi:hypothetical protein
MWSIFAKLFAHVLLVP